MSRSFDGDKDNTMEVNIGDVTDARFERATAWTYLSFFNANTLTGDDRTIVAKQDAFNVNQQFWIRIKPPTNFYVRTNNNAATIDGTYQPTLGVWHLVAVICDGTETADDLTLYVMDMDLTLHENATTGTHQGDVATLTEPIKFGSAGSGNKDPWFGELAYCAYIQQALSLQQIKEYRFNPGRVAAQFAANLKFFHPLGLASTEPDWSGNGNSGTLAGSPQPSIGDMPPTAPLYAGWQFSHAAAAAEEPAFSPYWVRHHGHVLGGLTQ